MTGSGDSASTRRRVWVICEGKHEHGGALESLIRRIMTNPDDCEFEFESWKSPRGKSRKFRSTSRGDGVLKKFVSILYDAQSLGFDRVIAGVDCDRAHGRIRSIDQAQRNDEFLIPRAFGIAIETFDAWFLADEKALSRVFSLAIETQPAPESNRDAKASMAAIRDASGVDIGLADAYARLSEIIDLDMVARRCNKGFAVWRDRVAKL
ncbi:hypothetical protein [Stieleria varia]|uniref:DUF4276 family protein n=1 Tax=Stieleria varia TaxID=2528005 RepID=A0A5C6A3G4_9BACT|nr:hypothetical protein [Stieleria varia]TWT93946.1 hypothetical protein Pla52n_57740 [Stieleria varia]